MEIQLQATIHTHIRTTIPTFVQTHTYLYTPTNTKINIHTSSLTLGPNNASMHNALNMLEYARVEVGEGLMALIGAFATTNTRARIHMPIHEDMCKHTWTRAAGNDRSELCVQALPSPSRLVSFQSSPAYLLHE